MKKLLLSLLLLIPSYGLSQTQNPTLTRTYDIDTNNRTTQGLNIANRSITSHIFTWSVQRGAMTACTLSFQTSFNNSTWVENTTGDCSTTGSTGYLSFVANYIRITATTFTVLTAPATVTVSWAGYIVSPASGSVTGLGVMGECAVWSTTTALTSDPCGTGVSAAAGQILYGTGASYTSAATFTYSATDGVLIGSGTPAADDYRLAILGSITSDQFSIIEAIHDFTPASNGADIIGLDLEVMGQTSSFSNEMYGAYIEATSGSTNGSSGIRGIHVAVKATGGAMLDKAVGIEIGENISSATELFGLEILSMTGGSTTRAIVTHTGIVEFGDTVNMLSGLSVASLTSTGAATGKKVVCVDTGTGILYASTSGTDCAN